MRQCGTPRSISFDKMTLWSTLSNALVIWITLRIWESKVRNPDPPDRRRFVLSEHISCFIVRSSYDSVLQYAKISLRKM